MLCSEWRSNFACIEIWTHILPLVVANFDMKARIITRFSSQSMTKIGAYLGVNIGKALASKLIETSLRLEAVHHLWNTFTIIKIILHFPEPGVPISLLTPWNMYTNKSTLMIRPLCSQFFIQWHCLNWNGSHMPTPILRFTYSHTVTSSLMTSFMESSNPVLFTEFPGLTNWFVTCGISTYVLARFSSFEFKNSKARTLKWIHLKY